MSNKTIPIKAIVLIILCCAAIFFAISCDLGIRSQIGDKNNSEKKIFPFNNYETVEIYSFNENRKIIDSVESQKESTRIDYDMNEVIRLGKLEEWREKNKPYSVFGEYSIIDSSYKLATSSNKIRLLNDQDFLSLRKIFNLDEIDVLETLCIPTYRDGIVFRKGEKIIGWIDICFECHKIKSRPTYEFALSGEQWLELEKLLTTYKAKS